VKGLAIKDVAEQTGITAATIRVWEQRYGFPEPSRTPSGYRVYTDEDVAALRRVSALRESGLSVPAAVERARATSGISDRPSIYGAILSAEDAVPARQLRKSTLLRISRAIEDETLARAAGPVVIAAFQSERNYLGVEHRYERLAANADACVVFADFPEVSDVSGHPIRVPISPQDALGNEWAVVVDAPGFATCLLAWETPESQSQPGVPDRERRFETLWTLDPRIVRRASLVGAALAGRRSPALGRRLETLLRDRPQAFEAPVPALTALTNRIVDYLEGA
jgi:MerR family transcriptional regulator, light-induced transcriptional regulator